MPYPGSGVYPGVNTYPGITGSVEVAGFVDIDGGRGRLPAICVEIDFDNNPTNSTRVWTNITADVRQLSYSRAGRSDALQQTSAGTLSMLLDNRDGAYDPTNTSSPHYPGVKRMRWIRVRALWDEVIYPRWQGLIETWDQGWPSFGKDAVVSVSATDALKVLNLSRIGTLEYPAQLSGERVAAVCADIGLESSVSDGVSTIIATASGTASIETSALSHLQQVEDTEIGRLFADAEGKIVFQDRHWRLVNAQTSQGTIGDEAGDIPYRETALAYDDDNIWNEAAVRTASDVERTAEDLASQLSYYRRTLSKSLLTDDEAEAQSAAEYLVRIYKDPAPKLPVLPLLPIVAPEHWPTVLGAANGQRFTFKRTPEDSDQILFDGFVEQVSDAIVVGTSWDVSVQLSAATDSAFWVLGESALGTDTALAY